MERKYNTKSPAVKRLMREAAELSSPTGEYYAAPLEENLFEWHFTVRGPEGSEFQEGVYHGRIIVPTEYPMKPPDIILLTPNGRFAVGQKICLSISGHHPETWQPSWSIRTALLAIIGFMTTPGKGSIGSLDYTPEERKVLAKRSGNYHCDTCGLKPYTLLLPPSQSSTVNKEEVREIVESVQLKGEKEKESVASSEATATTSTPSTASTAAVIPTATASGSDLSQSPKAAAQQASTASTPAGVTAVETAGVAASPTTAVGAGRMQTDNSVEESVPANGFQVYDLVIGIIVVLISLLVLRRFADQGSGDLTVDDTTEDVADMSE